MTSFFKSNSLRVMPKQKFFICLLSNTKSIFVGLVVNLDVSYNHNKTKQTKKKNKFALEKFDFVHLFCIDERNTNSTKCSSPLTITNC